MRLLVTAAVALAMLAAAAGCGTSDEDEIRAVTGEVQRSLKGKKDLARACELLTPRAEAQLSALLGASAGDRCVDVVGGADEAGEDPTAAEIAAATIRVRDDLAVLDAAGDDADVGLARVDGNWRVDNVLNPSLDPPARSSAPRLTEGSDKRQLLATYAELQDAFADRDHKRTCAVLSTGAEAQLVVAVAFVGLFTGSEGGSDRSCAASLKTIADEAQAPSAFAAGVPSAADLAAAEVTVDGSTATVRLAGHEGTRFVREEGRWLAGPSDEEIAHRADADPARARALLAARRRVDRVERGGSALHGRRPFPHDRLPGADVAQGRRLARLLCPQGRRRPRRPERVRATFDRSRRRLREPLAEAQRRRQPRAVLRRGLGHALVVARQAVVGDRLPGRGVGDELAGARPDAGIAVDRAETHADELAGLGIADEQRRAAGRAEDLAPAAGRLPVA